MPTPPLRRLIAALGLVALLLPLTLHAQQAPAPHADRIADAHAQVEAAMAEHGFPGLAIAVAVDGERVWAEGFGYANVEHRVPVWPDVSTFRIGSISKPLTAVAVAQLYADGRLDVDAPVQRYVPSFPEKAYPVTTRQLGAHLGGIRHYRDEEFLLAEAFPTVADGLTIFQDDSLEHEPGTQYLYSSYGWNLISAVIEGASGEDFLGYMDRHVFGPLRLYDTMPDVPAQITPHRVAFYVQEEDGKLMNAPHVDNSYKWAGGGFLSTVDDLLTFADALLGDAFLSPEAKNLLFTEQQTTTGEGVDYGFGFFVREDDDGRRVVGHTGGSVGGTSILLMQPGTGVVLAMCINQSGADLDVARAIFASFVEAVDS